MTNSRATRTRSAVAMSPMLASPALKEIFTPQWRTLERGVTGVRSLEEEPVNNDGDDNSGSSEDTSDEYYVKFHFKKELEERRRFISNKNTLPILMQEFPQEFNSEKPEASTDYDHILPPSTRVAEKLRRCF